MKKNGFITKYLLPVFGLLVAILMTMTPTVAYASASGFSGEDGFSDGGPASNDTDVKIIDSMPIIWSNSDLNAALYVLDMGSGEAVNLDNQTVPIGTVLTYLIAYRNTNDFTETVHLQIPVLDDYPLRTSYQGSYVGTLVNWDSITVEPGETVTRYITCDTPHATGMLPNTGLVMISDGNNMQTNTVNVAVAAGAEISVVPEPTVRQQEDTGVLGAMRRALRAAEDSPAVLGMRRAIQTGDVPYIVTRVALLAAICAAIASVIVLLVRHKKTEA